MTVSPSSKQVGKPISCVSTSTSTTTAKKLTPAERLMRKRAAARLRQQRCRARKREAQLEKGRSEKSSNRGACAASPSAAPKAQVPPVTSNVTSGTSLRGSPARFSPPPHVVGAEPRFDHRHFAQPHWFEHPRTSPSPIFNCISFESQRSFDEPRWYGHFAPHPAQRRVGVTTPEPANASALVSPAAPSGKSVVSLPESSSTSSPSSDDGEEAAIAAMLSLKSGGSPSRESAPASRQVPVLPSMTGHHPQGWADWEATRQCSGNDNDNNNNNGAYSQPHNRQAPGQPQWNMSRGYAPMPYSSSPYLFQPVEMYGV